MANTIATATLFQTELDKAAVQGALTGWMESNAGQVKYSGGKEVKIPKLKLQGMTDYSKATGYNEGDIVYEYETRIMTQDRGRKFSIDAMDVDESGFVLTAGTIMGEFQREYVIPEIDAYRLSKIATTVIASPTNAAFSYTPAEADVIKKIKAGIKVIRENGYNGELIIHATGDTVEAIENASLGKLTAVTFSVGGIDTKVPAIDRCPIIETPQNRMYSAITLANSGVGGYTKGSTAVDVNFLIMPRVAPIAISKQDNMRIFDPQTNQAKNAWAMDYRKYHDLWVKDNAAELIFANFKQAKPAGV